jgi:RNA polymerase sigma-70 factor (ECF subfamily)
LGEAMRRGYVAAFRLLGNPDESRDACQEAAARALNASDRYDPDKPFYPWFHRILRNHCVDRLRRRKRLVQGDDSELVDDAPTAESSMFESERSRAVVRGIADLPDDLREIIELRHFQDASYEEIATILDCPLGTVMSRLYRARKALRAKLMRDPGFVGHHGKGGAA